MRQECVQALWVVARAPAILPFEPDSYQCTISALSLLPPSRTQHSTSTTFSHYPSRTSIFSVTVAMSFSSSFSWIWILNLFFSIFLPCFRLRQPTTWCMPQNVLGYQAQQEIVWLVDCKRASLWEGGGLNQRLRPKKKREPLDKQFNCPFCNHEKSCEVNMWVVLYTLNDIHHLYWHEEMWKRKERWLQLL